VLYGGVTLRLGGKKKSSAGVLVVGGIRLWPGGASTQTAEKIKPGPTVAHRLSECPEGSQGTGGGNDVQGLFPEGGAGCG